MSMNLTICLKILLANQDGEFLVLQRPSSSIRNPSKWDFPGGKMTLEKPYLLELRREVKEETGLDIEVERIIGITETLLPLQKVITLIFRGRASSKDIKLSDEHTTFKWIIPDQMDSLELTDKLQAFFKENHFREGT